MLSLVLAAYLCFNLQKATRIFEQQTLVFDSLLHTMPNGVVTYVLDNQLTILYANEGFYKIIGYTPEEFRCQFNSSGLSFAGSPQLFEKLAASGSDFIANFSLEFSLRRQDGSTVWILANCYRRSNYQSLNTISYLMVDITAQKMQEQQLRLEKEQYDIANELSDDIIFEYDIANDTMKHSKKYAELFSTAPVIKNYSRFIEKTTYFPLASLERIKEYFHSAIAGQTLHNLELQALTAPHTYTWFCLNSKTIFDDNHVPLKIIGKLNNIDAQKNAIAQLQNKALRDPLTDLYNKTATENMINQSLMTLSMLSDERSALLAIDLDDFKKINDSYGHLTGDEVLQSVALAIKSIFPTDSIVGRIGGDEFIAFIDHLPPHMDISEKVHLLATAIGQIHPGSKKNPTITASIGIAIAPQNGMTYRSLFKAADEALYQTKNSGKNHFALAAKKYGTADA